MSITLQQRFEQARDFAREVLPITVELDSDVISLLFRVAPDDVAVFQQPAWVNRVSRPSGWFRLMEAPPVMSVTGLPAARQLWQSAKAKRASARGAVLRREEIDFKGQASSLMETGKKAAY